MDAPDPTLAGLDRIILQFRAIKRDLDMIERIWERDNVVDNLRPDPDCRHPDRR
jgi:hypothetical protein